MADPTGVTFLDSLGLRLPDLVAGLAGGAVNAVVFRRVNPWAAAGSMVVGGLTANYLGEPAAHVLSLGNGAASFIVGVAGMALCQAIISAAQNWRPNLPGSAQ